MLVVLVVNVGVLVQYRHRYLGYIQQSPEEAKVLFTLIDAVSPLTGNLVFSQ